MLNEMIIIPPNRDAVFHCVSDQLVPCPCMHQAYGSLSIIPESDLDPEIRGIFYYTLPRLSSGLLNSCISGK